MGDIYQLVYASRALQPFSDDELTALLSSIRPKNQARAVTGMLLYDDLAFLQILEGQKGELATLFELIQKDPRHHHIVTILEKPISQRQFGDWSMGFERVNKTKLASLEGLNDFYSDKTCLADVDAGRAKKILQAFQQGRWHQ